MPKTGTRPTRSATAAAGPGSAAGSPGPLERKTPSGSSARTSSAVVAAGTTVTVPSVVSRSTMVAFTPKSKATTRRPLVAPAPVPGWTLGSVAVTPDTRSIPSVPAADAAAARSSASGAVPNAQGTAPASRTCRVRRRVSTPVRAGTP